MSEISDNIRATFVDMVRIYEEVARFFLDAGDRDVIVPLDMLSNLIASSIKV